MAPRTFGDSGLGRDNLISESSEESRRYRKMRLWQKLLLLPKLESSTEDVNPCRKHEGCKLEPQNFQDVKLHTGNLLDSPRSVQNHNVTDCCLIRSNATAVSSSGSVRPDLYRRCCGFRCASLPDSEVVPTPAAVRFGLRKPLGASSHHFNLLDPQWPCLLSRNVFRRSATALPAIRSNCLTQRHNICFLHNSCHSSH